MPTSSFFFTKKVAQQKLWFLLMAILIKLCFSQFMYLMSDSFSYYGLLFYPRSSWQILLSYVAFTFVTLGLDLDTRKGSNVTQFMLYFFCYIPITVQYEMYVGRDWSMYWSLTALFLLLPHVKRLLVLRFINGSRALNQSQFMLILFLLAVFCLALVVWQYGISTSLPVFDEVYDQREEFKDNSNRLGQYAFNWLGNVLAIAMVVLGFYWKKIGYILIGLLISIYLFSLGGHKSVLFVGPFAMFILLTYRIFRKKFFLYFTSSFCVLLVAMLIGDLVVQDTTLASSILVRRGFILPAQIYYHYGSYFNGHDLNYFSHSFPFSLIMQSNYAAPIPSVIGQRFFPFSETVYANGNIFADTFANVGYFAFPLLLFVLSIFYALLDKFTEAKPPQVYIPLVFVTGFTLINSGLIVSMITHGFLIGIILMVVFPHKKYSIWSTKNKG